MPPQPAVTGHVGPAGTLVGGSVKLMDCPPPLSRPMGQASAAACRLPLFFAEVVPEVVQSPMVSPPLKERVVRSSGMVGQALLYIN